MGPSKNIPFAFSDRRRTQDEAKKSNVFREGDAFQFLQNIFFALLLVLFFSLSGTKVYAQCGGINFKAITKTRGCPLLVVKFSATGTSSAAGTTFQWDFGNGFINGNDTITAAFSNPGQYTIRMQARLSGASTACPIITKDTFITVFPLPVPVIDAVARNFKRFVPVTVTSYGFKFCALNPNPSFTPPPGDSPTRIIYINNTPNQTKGNWVINSKSDSEKTDTIMYPPSPSGPYPVPGSYLVNLFSTNKYGCQGFTSKTLEIYDSVAVDICGSFNLTPDSIHATFLPYVVDQGNDAITGYSWSFPGSTTPSSTSKIPPPEGYANPLKSRDASLTVTMSTGCVYPCYKTGYVCSPLTPAFQTECAAGFRVDCNCPLNNFSGNFPNGIFVPVYPPGPPPPGILSYPTAGRYSANVSYSYNYGGCITNANYPTFVNVHGPVAGFISHDNQVCALGDTVHFINQTDTVEDSTVRYTWYIFDSTDKKLLATNNIIGPTATYDTFYIPKILEKFGVSLVATSLSGCEDSINKNVFIIAARPKSDFDSLSKPFACLGGSMSLNAAPTPAEGKFFNYKYKWYIKDELLQTPPDSAFIHQLSYTPDSLGPYDITLYVSNGHCSSDTTKKAIFKVIGDLTKIVATKTAGCLNPDFQTMLSLGHEEKYPNDPAHPPLYQWYLDINAGASKPYISFLNPDSPSTKVIITKNGCYPIHLSISTIVGGDTCVQTYNAPDICAGPGLDFSIGQLTCPPDTQHIINYSPVDAFGFKWKIFPANLVDILDPDTSRNIRAVFKADTCYWITLAGSRIVNGVICSDVDSEYSCFDLPRPNFYVNPSSFYCAPVVANFINTTTNKDFTIGYIWDFGDGTPYNALDTTPVAHVYRHFTKTSYPITLTAYTPYGCPQSITKTTAIDLVGPVPLFTMDNSTGCDSVLIHFTNISKNVKKFYFFNGDASPPDSVSLPPHLYVLNDTSRDSIFFYPVLQSLGDTLCADYFQDTIKIYRASTDAKVLTNITLGCVPLTVQFNAVSKLATNWKWDFDGDGIIDDSVHQNPVFTYTKPGKYKAVLVASNHGQCPITTFSNLITVAPNAVAGFRPSVKAFCGTQDISFLNTSKNTVRFTFDFGDGSPMDSNAIPIHKYFYNPLIDTGAAIYFYPKFVAVNAAGCSDSLTDTITAFRLPIAGFSYSNPLGCAPLKVSFIDTSKFNFATEWDFDNNGTIDAYGKTVSHIYSPGLYTPKMRAISIQGCVDSTVKVNIVNVNVVPVADFSVSDSDICYKDSVLFVNLTEPADSVVKWYWKFDDPAAPYDTTSVKSPHFAFYSTGLHTVSLTAIDNRGCLGNIRKIAVFVEDTLAPQNTKLLYVSVVDNHTIQVVYNKNGLHHFDSYLINRLSGATILTDSVKQVNDTSFLYLDNSINTSDSSYCFNIQTQNQCGRISSFSTVHCTILLNGTANTGPVNVLNWSAYSGWDPDRYYIYKADSGSTLKLVDSVKGNILTWSDTTLCDQTYCYYIAAKKDSSGYVSNSNSICLKAKYIRQNTPLYMHFATVINNSEVQLQWDSSGYKGLVGYLLGKYNSYTGWVDNYVFTKTNTYADASTKVNDSSYIYRVQTIDKCGYLSPESNIGTSILLKQKINNDNVALSWNGYHNWTGGVQNYLVQIQLKNKQFKTVANLPGTDTTYTDDSVYNAIDTAYCYRVIAIENGTRQDSSISNLTCAVLPSRVFVPNAFSPNGDSTNDIWRVSALSVFNVVGTKLTSFDAKIYNRWGSLVFESNDIYKGWDGNYKGAKAPADLYIFMISARGIDDKSFQVSGNLMLLR